MRIVWSPEATADLAQLREYIARDNPDAAQRVVERIFNSVGRDLSENPELGHPGRVPGARVGHAAHTRHSSLSLSERNNPNPRHPSPPPPLAATAVAPPL